MLQNKPAIDALIAFEMNGMHPFETSARDMAQTSLESAHALAIMLGSAFSDCDETASTNGEIIRRAFDGIACLVALAAFAGEAA